MGGEPRVFGVRPGLLSLTLALFHLSPMSVEEQILSDLSEAKEKSKAATDFTLPEAIETFGLKYVQTLDKYQRDHAWDIEKDVGEVEFPITPCIGETLMPSC